MKTSIIISLFNLYFLLVCTCGFRIEEEAGLRPHEKAKNGGRVGAEARADISISSCSSPVALGMENRDIPDKDLTASSWLYYRLDFYGPQFGRLNLSPDIGLWIKHSSDTASWIQVDLQDDLSGTITGLQTQGSAGADKYVSAFKVLSGLDACTLEYVVDSSGTPEIFTASSSAVTTHTFPQPVQARIIRIEPTTCNEYCALRFEVLGCPDSALVSPDPAPLETAVCSIPEGFGMETGALSDSLITSSSYDGTKDITMAKQARLNNDRSWSADRSSDMPWIQVDLFGSTDNAVSGVITQGNPRKSQWVTSFSVQVGDEECSLQYIMGSDNTPQVFEANSDKDSEVTNMFSTPVKARFVRMYTTQWYGFPALRFEVLGCFL